MSLPIPESDWKVFRDLHRAALNRHCTQTLAELRGMIATVNAEAHAQYLEVFRFLREKDEEVANTFNDFRRSTAMLQIINMRRNGLLTEAEFARFSEGTREAVQRIVKASR